MRVIQPLRLLPALALGAAAAAAAPAGVTGSAVPGEVFLLPGDSVLVFGADVRGFFASRLWAQVGSGELGASAGLPPDKAAEMARETQDGMAKGMAEMEAELGFRADRDVDWALFGQRGQDAPEPRGVGVLTGRFDAGRILAAVEAAQAKAGNTLARKQAGAATILSVERGGRPRFSLAVPDAAHLVIGDALLVEAVLESYQARRQPLGTNEPMKNRLAAVKPGAGVFVLAGEALLEKMRRGDAPPPVPLPRGAAFSVWFDAGSEIEAEMRSAEDAQQAAATIQAQLGLFSALLSQDKDPQKAMMGTLLAGLAVEVEGPTLRVSGGSGGGLGLVAAIAIPSMLRARVSANEAAAIGDLRAVVSAQAAYQAATDGFYGELACLGAPATCIKGYTGPELLDTKLTSLEAKSGYRRAFHAGPRGPSPRTLRGFAYTAVPLERGKTGVRSFCADASGTVRFDPEGEEIAPVGGVCPADLQSIR